MIPTRDERLRLRLVAAATHLQHAIEEVTAVAMELTDAIGQGRIDADDAAVAERVRSLRRTLADRMERAATEAPPPAPAADAPTR